MITNCIFWANDTEEIYVDSSSPNVNYCDIQGGWPSGIGNINLDPCFASFDPNGDPNLWDFHLKSVYGRWNQNSQIWVTDPNTSLCIDAGDPNSDWGSEPWPNGKRINMGAYGGTNQASKNGNPADFNVDNSVNFADFAQMANQWLVEQMCIEDLTNDGKVNFADISIFAENWLWEKK